MAMSRGRFRMIRIILMQRGWVCALGLDLCHEHSNGYGSIAKMIADEAKPAPK